MQMQAIFWITSIVLKRSECGSQPLDRENWHYLADFSKSSRALIWSGCLSCFYDNQTAQENRFRKKEFPRAAQSQTLEKLDQHITGEKVNRTFETPWNHDQQCKSGMGFTESNNTIRYPMTRINGKRLTSPQLFITVPVGIEGYSKLRRQDKDRKHEIQLRWYLLKDS